MVDFFSNIFEHFVDPRKRVFLGYIFLSIVIAFVWLYKAKGLNLKQSLLYIFDKRVLLSKSSKSDFKLFFFNRIFLLFVSPLLITQIAIATAIYYFLHSFSWLTVGMLSSVPTYLVIGLFTLFVFTLDDFTKFIVHRWMHKISFLWALHKVHHSATTLTPLTIYRTHPLEGILFSLRASFTQGVSISLFVFFFGNSVDLFTILGVNIFIFCFNVAGANLRHSHIGIQYWRWLEYIIISPAQHQLHHSVAEEHYDKNFGATLAFWDWCFGSLVPSEKTENLKLGLTYDKETKPHSLFTLYVRPFIDIYNLATLRVRKTYKYIKTAKNRMSGT